MGYVVAGYSVALATLIGYTANILVRERRLSRSRRDTR